MERIIYKYPLFICGNQFIEHPAKAILLCIKEQHGCPVVWMSVDMTEPMVKTHVSMFPTGVEFDDEGFKYIDTLVTGGRHLIWHVYVTTNNLVNGDYV